MSEVGQAPPQGPEGIPVRAPSKPSRLPLYIWSGVAAFCLLMFASALALFLWSRESLESRDLKKATSVRINYVVNGNRKSVVVSDPAGLRDLLSSLEITDTRMGIQYGLNNQSSVEFTLANGSIARIQFMTTQLDRVNWGSVTVTSAFYQKVNSIATRAEGKPIDVLKPNN